MKQNRYLFALLLSFFLSIATNSTAQTVKTSKDSVFAAGFTSTSEFDFADIYESFYFKNVDAASDSFRWRRVFNNLPSVKWESAVCDIYLCHGTGVDSSDFIMAKGDSGMFYAHFYPEKVGGVGEMVIEIYNIQDPTQVVSIYARATAWDKLNSVSNIESNTQFFYPNPAHDVFQVEMKETGVLSIYNVNGQRVYKKEVVAGINDIYIAEFTPGLYIVELETTTHTRKQRLVKQ
jgi:hypothetical protein